MAGITLRHMEYLVAVIDEGSMTAAAARLHVTQATVSMALAECERRLGVPLLVRQPAKGVAATLAGHRVAVQARRILGLVLEMEASVLAMPGELAGDLEVGCVPSLSPQAVPVLAEHFSRRHPRVTLHYREGAATDLQREVLHGRLEMAVMFSRQQAPGLRSIEVARAQLKVMLPEGHRLAAAHEVAFADVAQEPAILIDLPPSTERSLEFMRAAGVEPTLRWSSNNLATVASLVGAGLGWSLRYTLPGEQPAARGLVEIPVADPTPPNAVCAVVPDGDRVDRRVRHALEVLRRVLSEEEGRPDVDCA